MSQLQEFYFFCYLYEYTRLLYPYPNARIQS